MSTPFLKQLSEKLSDCEDELDAVSMDYSACEDLVRDEVVTKISQYNDEVVALEAHIRDLEKKLPTVSSEDGDYQDYESVQAAEKSITEKTRALRRKVQADRNTETDHARKLNDIQVGSLTHFHCQLISYICFVVELFEGQ